MSTADDTVTLLAGQPLDAVDLQAFESLARLVELVDPVPSGLIDRIGMALTIEALHAEVAQLRLVGEPALAVRTDETSIEAGTITFTTDVLTVMISIHPEAGRVRVDGWAAPAETIEVELHQGADVVATISDEDGRFSFVDIDRGPARLVLRRTSDPTVPVVTPQIEL